MAKDKARSYPLNEDKMGSIRLHESINELQQTLLRTLPDLIQKLNPDTIGEFHTGLKVIFIDAGKCVRHSAHSGDTTSITSWMQFLAVQTGSATALKASET
jgi:hypothetical protein